MNIIVSNFQQNLHENSLLNLCNYNCKHCSSNSLFFEPNTCFLSKKRLIESEQARSSVNSRCASLGWFFFKLKTYPIFHYNIYIHLLNEQHEFDLWGEIFIFVGSFGRFGDTKKDISKLTDLYHCVYFEI